MLGILEYRVRTSQLLQMDILVRTAAQTAKHEALWTSSAIYKSYLQNKHNSKKIIPSGHDFNDCSFVANKLQDWQNSSNLFMKLNFYVTYSDGIERMIQIILISITYTYMNSCIQLIEYKCHLKVELENTSNLFLFWFCTSFQYWHWRAVFPEFTAEV